LKQTRPKRKKGHPGHNNSSETKLTMRNEEYKDERSPSARSKRRTSLPNRSSAVALLKSADSNEGLKNGHTNKVVNEALKSKQGEKIETVIKTTRMRRSLDSGKECLIKAGSCENGAPEENWESLTKTRAAASKRRKSLNSVDDSAGSSNNLKGRIS